MEKQDIYDYLKTARKDLNWALKYETHKPERLLEIIQEDLGRLISLIEEDEDVR